MEEKRKYKSSTLIKRFLPYYKKYIPTLVLDLFCASLTTICEIVLPLIMREITNAGMNDLATLTIGFVLRVGVLYLVLRLIDSAAFYYIAYTGHVMGTKMETDMRRDAYSHQETRGRFSCLLTKGTQGTVLCLDKIVFIL